MPSQARTFWISLTLLTLVLAWREWPLENTETVTDLPPAIKPASYPVLSVEKGSKVLNFETVRTELGYPQMAYDAGIQGKVDLIVHFTTEGRYQSHQVVDSFHPLLRMASEAYAARLQAEPVPSGVARHARLSFSFEIPDYGKPLPK
jgi:outer membrane biosynthesis protein TonB